MSSPSSSLGVSHENSNHSPLDYFLVDISLIANRRGRQGSRSKTCRFLLTHRLSAGFNKSRFIPVSWLTRLIATLTGEMLPIVSTSKGKWYFLSCIWQGSMTFQIQTKEKEAFENHSANRCRVIPDGSSLPWIDVLGWLWTVPEDARTSRCMRTPCSHENACCSSHHHHHSRMMIRRREERREEKKQE